LLSHPSDWTNEKHPGTPQPQGFHVKLRQT
jgi:hypothetical protein